MKVSKIQRPGFFQAGICKLPDRWPKVIASEGVCFE